MSTGFFAVLSAMFARMAGAAPQPPPRTSSCSLTPGEPRPAGLIPAYEIVLPHPRMKVPGTQDVYVGCTADTRARLAAHRAYPVPPPKPVDPGALVAVAEAAAWVAIGAAVGAAAAGALTQSERRRPARGDESRRPQEPAPKAAGRPAGSRSATVGHTAGASIGRLTSPASATPAKAVRRAAQGSARTAD